MKRLLYILLPCILLAISVGCDGGATVDGPTAGSAADPTKGMDNLTPGGGMSPGIPEEAATEEAATEEAATEEAATLRKKPLRKKPLRKKPLQKKPLRKKPLQKKKLQKKPLQKKPLQKKPLQKKPLRKKPLRKKKLQKKPLQKKPLQKKKLQKKKLQKKKLQNDRSCGPFSGCLSTTGPNVISPMPVRGLQTGMGCCLCCGTVLVRRSTGAAHCNVGIMFRGRAATATELVALSVRGPNAGERKRHFLARWHLRGPHARPTTFCRHTEDYASLDHARNACGVPGRVRKFLETSSSIFQ